MESRLSQHCLFTKRKNGVPRKKSEPCCSSAQSAALEDASCNPQAFTPNPYSKYYKILGVEDTAQLPEIRAAFLKLAKENNPSQDSKIERYMEITEAYQIIKKSLQENYNRFCFAARLNHVFDRVFAITEAGNPGDTNAEISAEAQSSECKLY